MTLAALLAIVLLGGVAGCSRKTETSGSGLSPAARGTSGASSSASAAATASDTPAVKAVDSAETSATSDSNGTGGTGGSGSSSSTGAKPATPAKPATKPAVKPGMKVLILFWNDTNSKPLKGTEIVIGSSSYKPNTSGKSDRGTLGTVPYGELVKITVYPDGRSGKKIQVPLIVTRGMIPNSEQDAIHVAISDGSVRVLGNAISNLDQTVPRF